MVGENGLLHGQLVLIRDGQIKLANIYTIGGLMNNSKELLATAKALADKWEMPRPRSIKQAAMLLCGVEIGKNQMQKAALHALVNTEILEQQSRHFSL